MGNNSIIKNNTIDFLGVNYYQPRRVKAKESEIDKSKGWMPDEYFDNYEMPGRRMNPYRGWEIYPQCMYDIAINIRDNYNNVINYNVTKTALKYQIQVRITLKGVRSTLKGGIYGFNR